MRLTKISARPIAGTKMEFQFTDRSTACSLTLFLTTSSASSDPLCYPVQLPAITAANRSRKRACPFKILARASAISNHAARSSSGNGCFRPDSGGHSISNTLLFSKAASQSSSTAQAWTIFPPGCFAEPRGRDLPRGLYPVYSANSRFAAARGASPSPIRPFGIDHDPRSLLRQNGPPGWPSRTSIPPAVGR